MQYDDREIFIRNLDNSGMFEMLSKIFQSTVKAHKTILQHNQTLRRQFIRFFERYEDEYAYTNRSEIFFGTKTGEEVRNEAFDYGIGQTMKLFMVLKTVEVDAFNDFIALTGNSPKEFLTAIKDIMNPDENRGGNGQW